MLWPITRAITSTCYSKTEQIVVVPLNKNNGPFKICDFFAHPVWWQCQSHESILLKTRILNSEKHSYNPASIAVRIYSNHVKIFLNL